MSGPGSGARQATWDAFIDPETPPIARRRQPVGPAYGRGPVAKSLTLEVAMMPIDWRARGVLSAAREQGDANTCTSFAICGAIEARVRLAGRPGVQLAPGFINTCLFGFDRYRGIWGGDALDQVELHGVGYGFAGDYPFPPGRCNNCTRQKIAGYDSLDSETAAYAALRKGPIVADLYIDLQAFADLGRNEVYARPRAAQARLHTVTIVGCDPARRAWIVQNSAGPGWADRGCGLVAFGAGGLLTERWGWEIRV